MHISILSCKRACIDTCCQLVQMELNAELAAASMSTLRLSLISLPCTRWQPILQLCAAIRGAGAVMEEDQLAAALTPHYSGARARMHCQGPMRAMCSSICADPTLCAAIGGAGAVMEEDQLAERERHITGEDMQGAERSSLEGIDENAAAVQACSSRPVDCFHISMTACA